MNKWTENNETHMYFNENTGRIIGMAHRIGVSGPWYLAKVCSKESNDYDPIGNYITLDFAKLAVEQYYRVLDNTINETQKELLN